MASENKEAREYFPAVMLEDVWGAWKSQALAAARELEIFEHIAAGKRSVGQLAAAARATPRGMRGLLDTLVAMRYLGKRGDQYNLRPPADAYLVPGSSMNLWPLVEAARASWSDWANLAIAVRSGKPIAPPQNDPASAKHHSQLAAALFSLGRSVAPAAVNAFPPRRLPAIRDILEIGPGAGAWSLAFVPGLTDPRVTLLDSPHVSIAARDAIRAAGMEERYTFREGDLRRQELGNDSFDLLICAHALSPLGPAEARDLIRRCAAALRRGGSVLIAEFLPNDIRSDPPLALLYGLSLLLRTEQGDAYTQREFRAWMRDAGLHFSQTLDVGPFPALILGSK